MGLGAPVEVRQTSSGVSHLFARQEEDLFRAQGFVTARDRMFQIDTARRAASGRLAEWYGDVPALGFDPVLNLRGQGLASVDYMMRVFGLQEAAENGLSWLSPRTYRALLAYSEGINEWISQARKRKLLSLGYELLNTEPEGWKPTDSLLILRLLAFRLNFSWRLLATFGAVSMQLIDDPKRLHSLLPPHNTLSLEHLDSIRPYLPASPEPPASTPLSTEEPIGSIDIHGTGKGSCAWVVSGQHTRSGGPVLCNDPHLALGLPAAFHQIRLCGGEYNTIGLSIPGHPGIYGGHNESIAWGASLSRVDDADIFLEELTPTGDQYRNKERLLPLVQREEVIHIRGERPRHRWVRSTLRGPLLSDAIRGPMPSELAYSLSWTGHEGTRETEAILQLNRAKNWDQFQRALSYARVPSLGFVYADRKGNIGGIIAGRCPKRRHAKRPFHPLPGADGQFDWTGDIEYEALPRSFNPEQGFLVLSGQRPAAPLQGEVLQGFWEPDYRSQRIADLLQRKFGDEDKPNVEHMGRLQRDHYTLWGKDFISRHLKSFDKQSLLSPAVRGQFQMLLEWNGRMGTESLAASYFTMFQLKLVEKAYKTALGDDMARRWLDIAHELEPPIEALFRSEEAWFERGKDADIHFALTQAYHALQKRLGNDPNHWSWNRLHRLTLRPSFFWDSALVRTLHRGPFGTGGDAFSINTGTHSWSRPFEHRVGASARQAFDLAQMDQSQWILCGGQSEIPESNHYDDQLQHWLRGDLLPMQFAPSALHTAQRQWLLPHGQDAPKTSFMPTMNQTGPRAQNQENLDQRGPKETI